MQPTDWVSVWAAVADRMAAHRTAGRGHLLTEDVLRMETVLVLGDRGVEPGRLRAEVGAVDGARLDLVLDGLAGTVVEFKFPRDATTGASPDTMVLGALLRDVLRVAVVPAERRWVVQLLSRRHVHYLNGVVRRHGRVWTGEPGTALRLDPAAVVGLPLTARQRIGLAATPHPVTATCVLAQRVDPDLTLFAHLVDAPSSVPVGSVARSAAEPVVGETRDGARQEILDAALAVTTRHGRPDFTIQEVVDEMRRRHTRYAESTIRTMLASHLCAEATGVGVAGYADVTRIDRGRYRFTRPR